MAITKEQLIDLGFKPHKIQKGLSGKRFDSLVFKLNNDDYLFTGYSKITKNTNFKRLWKTFKDPETGELITYPVDRMGVLTLSMVKEFLETSVNQSKLKEEIYGDS